MSRQIRITIDDDEVFERLKRRKAALDLSWEDALRRGLRDSPEPPQSPEGSGSRRGGQSRGGADRSGRRRSGPDPGDDETPAFGPDQVPGPGQGLGEYIAREVRQAVPGADPGPDRERGGAPLSDEIDRLEDAEDAVLVLGEAEGERVPLRVALHTGPDGLDVEVVAVRSGKGTEGLNRFADGARADVARRFAGGDTVALELDGGQEVYDVRPDLTWARGDDGVPTVTDVAVRDVVFED